MPVMTGEEMLAKLRATDWGKKIKVIVLTNRGEQEIPPELKQMGVDAIILKAAMTPRQVAELVKTKLTEVKSGF
jgi:DNA-binding NarL/FixJ family response regulator